LVVAFAAWGGFIYFAFHSFIPAVLFGSFAVANLFSRLARSFCYIIMVIAADLMEDIAIEFEQSASNATAEE
jgi:hypothetical protein